MRSPSHEEDGVGEETDAKRSALVDGGTRKEGDAEFDDSVLKENNSLKDQSFDPSPDIQRLLPVHAHNMEARAVLAPPPLLSLPELHSKGVDHEQERGVELRKVWDEVRGESDVKEVEWEGKGVDSGGGRREREGVCVSGDGGEVDVEVLNRREG